MGIDPRSSIFHPRPKLPSLNCLEAILKFWHIGCMGRASRRKRQRKNIPPAFVQAVTNSLWPAPPPAAGPMGPLSAAIIELIEPYEHEATTLKMYKTLVGLASLCWNIAIVPEAEREAQLAEAAHELTTSDDAAVQEVIQTLIWRKHSLFPHDKRIIVGCEATMTPSGYRVTVTSACTA